MPRKLDSSWIRAGLAALAFAALAPAAPAQVSAFDPPLEHFVYLKASNTEAEDRFGIETAISGETLVVGAFAEDSGSPGVGGDQSDNSVSAAGAAFVFFRDVAAWRQQAYLKSAAPDQNDEFGKAVGVSGNTIVVGVSGEDSAATGVDGNPFDNSATDAGAAYVFVRDGSTWMQQAYLKASNTEFGDRFGHSVAISGDLIAIGARSEDGGAVGINGDPFDNTGALSGAVYVFARDGDTWQQEAYIKASNPDQGDFFGYDVALWGDTLVVSSIDESSAARGVNGNQLDNSAEDAGAAYVFVRDEFGTWTQQAYIKAGNADAEDLFGSAIDIWEDLLVVSALHEQSRARGVNGDANDNNNLLVGAAYVFRRTAGQWAQDAYLKPQVSGNFLFFGSDVAVANDRVVVGRGRSSGGGAGVHVLPAQGFSAENAGSATLYERHGACWNHRAYITATNPGEQDHFGDAVALSGDSLMVGSPLEASNATGPGGNQNNDSAMGAGALYVLEFTGPAPGPWSHEGCALPGWLKGDPLLSATGSLADGSPNTLALVNARVRRSLALFVGLTGTPAAFKGGTLLPVPVTLALFAQTDMLGEFTLPFDMPSGVPAGTELWVQVAIDDSTGLHDVTLSNAVRGLTP